MNGILERVSSDPVGREFYVPQQDCCQRVCRIHQTASRLRCISYIKRKTSVIERLLSDGTTPPKLAVGHSGEKPIETCSFGRWPQAGVPTSPYTIGGSRCPEISLDQGQGNVECRSFEIYPCIVWTCPVTTLVRRNIASTLRRYERKIAKCSRRNQEESIRWRCYHRWRNNREGVQAERIGRHSIWRSTVRVTQMAFKRGIVRRKQWTRRQETKLCQGRTWSQTQRNQDVGATMEQNWRHHRCHILRGLPISI